MGCSPSGPSRKKGAIRLKATKLSFTSLQLHELNTYFRKVVEDAKNDVSDTSIIEATVERLVQRLMLDVGDLDRKFSSVFLVSLNEPQRIKKLRFEYLLRIDALSTPNTNSENEILKLGVEEDASLPGFVYLKIFGADAEAWQEYMDVAGRIRRDLIKAKLANLLAAAIKRDVENPREETVFVSPGQVVDAEVLDKILKQRDYCRIFYGPADLDGPLPEPRNHRVALIEDAGGILLRIGLNGFKACEAEVRLLIGISVSSWPNLTDYPCRIPFYHCDALLHYTVAQSGMYAVAIGPYPGARCENRSTLWRIRFPAAEKIMSQHYAVDTVPALTEFVVLEILYQLRQGYPLDLPIETKASRNISLPTQGRLQVASRHIIRTIHRWTLERIGPDPLNNWAPDTLSRHVLLVLDELVAALKCQNLRCYFHPRCNVMLQCARGGIVHHEDSYVSDCRLLEHYLETLHYISVSMTVGIPRPLDVMEGVLLIKWKDIVASLPRKATNEDYGYSQRQLEYFSLILEQVLRTKNTLLEDHSESYSYLNSSELSHNVTEQVKNLLFLLRLVLTQAKDHVHAMTRKLRVHGHRKKLKTEKNYDITNHFDYSVELLINIVRRDGDTSKMDLESFPVMTRALIQWLHFGMDHDRKILGPVLCPYLNNLSNSLHEYSWCASFWKNKQKVYKSEMQSLSEFCRSVLTKEISPAEGIVQYFSRGWYWAESMTKMIEYSRNALRLILLNGDKSIKYKLTFTGDKGLSSFSTWSKARSVSTIARKKRMGSKGKELFDMLSELQMTSKNECAAGHTQLRDASPLTYVVSMSRSQVRHRGPGNLIYAMSSLGKFRVLQEVAALLPREEQVTMLGMVQRLARESVRNSKKTICSNASTSSKQIYKSRSESNLPDSFPRLSLEVYEQRIIAEHQSQLKKEMQEMHDTLKRNALMKQRPCIWDSHYVSSWNSSIDSVVETITLRKYRSSIWEAIKERSSVLPSDRNNLNTAKHKFGEMLSREESPAWSTLDTRLRLEDTKSKNEDELPSWDTPKAVPNRRLCNYDDSLAGSFKKNDSI